MTLLAEIDRRAGWAADGALSCVDWVVWRVGLARGTAKEKLRVAHEIRRRPTVRRAFAAGEVSPSWSTARRSVSRPSAAWPVTAESSVISCEDRASRSTSGHEHPSGALRNVERSWCAIAGDVGSRAVGGAHATCITSSTSPTEASRQSTTASCCAPRHHTLVHERRFTIRGDAPVRLTFHRAD
ncbi:MAG: DUF222 domain-containing protein [Actinobacteria bacterium]|nr:MAG: DUF222 domain-containing protein [Actinomycetota bacterium]